MAKSTWVTLGPGHSIFRGGASTFTPVPRPPIAAKSLSRGEPGPAAAIGPRQPGAKTLPRRSEGEISTQVATVSFGYFRTKSGRPPEIEEKDK